MNDENFQIELSNWKRNQHRLKSFSVGRFFFFPNQISLTQRQASPGEILLLIFPYLILIIDLILLISFRFT